jgi:hypothetical protein
MEKHFLQINYTVRYSEEWRVLLIVAPSTQSYKEITQISNNLQE